MNSCDEIFTDRAIIKDACIAAPRPTIWRAWTDEQEITCWFARGAKIELHPGGAYEIYFLMDQPPGGRGGEGNTIQSFRPGHLLAFTWNAPPAFGPLREIRTHVRLELSDVPGGTGVRLTHYGWRPGEAWNKVYDYFDRAWGNVLANLARHYGAIPGTGTLTP